MNKLWTFILLTLTVAVYGQTSNDKKIYYDSGKLEMEKNYDKSCNCDRMTEYYESGKLRSKKTYINGKLDGEDILYFENGTIDIYYFWKDGAPSGRIYCNHTNSKLAYEMFFNNKFKTGTWKYYNENGELIRETVFTENKTPWDSNDDYATDKFYSNNRLAYTTELVAGKKTNLVIADKDSYDKLVAAQPPLGLKLFRQNCAMCHSADVDIMGPKLKGVASTRSNDWLTKMITNGDALFRSGDKDAVTLYKKWNNVQHPNFERLSNADLLALIDYLRTLN